MERSFPCQYEEALPPNVIPRTRSDEESENAEAPIRFDCVASPPSRMLSGQIILASSTPHHHILRDQPVLCGHLQAVAACWQMGSIEDKLPIAGCIGHIDDDLT